MTSPGAPHKGTLLFSEWSVGIPLGAPTEAAGIVRMEI